MEIHLLLFILFYWNGNCLNKFNVLLCSIQEKDPKWGRGTKSLHKIFLIASQKLFWRKAPGTRLWQILPTVYDTCLLSSHMEHLQYLPLHIWLSQHTYTASFVKIQKSFLAVPEISTEVYFDLISKRVLAIHLPIWKRESEILSGIWKTSSCRVLRKLL